MHDDDGLKIFFIFLFLSRYHIFSQMCVYVYIYVKIGRQFYWYQVLYIIIICNIVITRACLSWGWNVSDFNIISLEP